MEGDYEFDSQHQILDGSYFMLICCKNCVYLKKTKINEREAAEHGPFLKGCLQVCWLSTIKLLS